MPKISHPDGRLARAIRAAESAEILKAIGETSGNVDKAAELLGVSRRNLYWRIEKLGLEKAAGVAPRDGGR